MENAYVLLERMPRTVISSYGNTIGDLSKEFAAVLGYKPLQERHESFMQLLKLSEMGIEPYTTDSVLKYKTQMVWDNTSLINHMANHYVFIFCAICLTFLGSLAYEAGAWLWHWSWPSILTNVTEISFVICVAIVALEKEIVKNIGTFEWVETPVGEYKQPIPLDILGIASKVKLAIPEAQLFVEQLHYKKVEDPFLVLKIKGDVFYIAVWDEPRFEGKKMQIGNQINFS